MWLWLKTGETTRVLVNFDRVQEVYQDEGTGSYLYFGTGDGGDDTATRVKESPKEIAARLTRMGAVVV